MTYVHPVVSVALTAQPQTVYLIASGDLREAANTAGWPAQEILESNITAALRAEGWAVQRANDIDPVRGHGFIRSQRMGFEVFQSIPQDAPLILAEAVWQYSHHVLAGLRSHRGPILIAGNWSGEWPGLVGLLNLNGSLTKAGIDYSTLWSLDWTDEWVRGELHTWLRDGRVRHDASHVHTLSEMTTSPEVELGRALAHQLVTKKAIIGTFDEGCMGMYNAIFDDELLNPLGIYKVALAKRAVGGNADRQRSRLGCGR